MALHQFSAIEGGAVRGFIEYISRSGHPTHLNIQNVIVERDSTLYRPTFIARDRSTGAEVYRETVSATETSLRLVRDVSALKYKMQAAIDSDTGQPHSPTVLEPPFNLELVA